MANINEDNLRKLVKNSFLDTKSKINGEFTKKLYDLMQSKLKDGATATDFTAFKSGLFDILRDDNALVNFNIRANEALQYITEFIKEVEEYRAGRKGLASIYKIGDDIEGQLSQINNLVNLHGSITGAQVDNGNLSLDAKYNDVGRNICGMGAGVADDYVLKETPIQLYDRILTRGL